MVNMAGNIDWSQTEHQVTCLEFGALSHRQRETGKGLLENTVTRFML